MKKVGELIGLGLYLDTDDPIVAKRGASIILHAFETTYPIKTDAEIDKEIDQLINENHGKS